MPLCKPHAAPPNGLGDLRSQVHLRRGLHHAKLGVPSYRGHDL